MQALEDVPEVEVMNPVDKKILDTWEKEAVIVDKHVQLSIPFKDPDVMLPNNYSGVLRRHQSLGRRLQKDPVLKEMYSKATEENLSSGISEPVPGPAEEGKEWYVPIQTVVAENKPGKCRLVGDVSYEFKGACLNSVVHQGPNVTTNLISVLVKFRRYAVAVSGDVKGMYNMVKVPPAQRDYLRFLGWKDNDPMSEVEVYRMTTQMFGGTWCPTACIFAFRWLARHKENDYDREIVCIILGHFYVDDMLTSFITDDVAIKRVTGVRSLLMEGSFLLTKLGSNSKAVLQAMPEAHLAKGFGEVLMGSESEAVEHTLGSVWRSVEDVLGYRTISTNKPMTRRGVLSVMSSLYDPLGLISPFILLARILLQEITKLGYEWDDVLTEDLIDRWKRWLTGLEQIQKFTIPRWLGMTQDEDRQYQIHLFSDASELGYGAIAFLCIYDSSEEIIQSTILAAKSRVAPMKVVTIPRLELTAAVLSVKLDRVLREYLEVPLKATVFWTDSTVVLHYVAGDAWQFKTFVSNRVAYIHEYTLVSQWRHVPGLLNVADVASRGLTGAELLECHQWVTGPEFLKKREEWPPRAIPERKEDGDNDLEFKRRYNFKYVPVKAIPSSPVVAGMMKHLLERHSSWTTLLRCVCWWHRCVYALKRGEHMKRGYIESSEIRRAELKVVQLAQQEYLTDEQLGSKIFKKLYTFTEDDVLRVGGRLMAATLTYEEKHPPVLPKCHLSKIYIMHVHELVGHSGVHRTYYECRKRFWILGGKPTVSAVLSDCITCQKLRGCAKEQIMAPLPSFRVEQGKVPFENVGVDFFGPILIKIGRAQHKRYGCIFTDLLMRAGHIEVVPDLTSAAFIDALQRFLSRRGKPRLIVSDNGTNFVGANRELKEAVKEWNVKQVGDFMAAEGILWRFNTPTASHHGGVWERLIRVIRSLMMSVIKDHVLTEYGLITYMCVIEQILNSRPLTKMTEDPEDPLPISPEHLLNLRQAQGIVGDFSKANVVRSRWKQIQHLGDRFWDRWSREYLRTLQARPKWMEEKENLKVGDLVLVMQENTARLRWPLGLVQEVVIGRDKLVRSVRVKTERGEYVRPITKVVGLECEK